MITSQAKEEIIEKKENLKLSQIQQENPLHHAPRPTKTVRDKGLMDSTRVKGLAQIRVMCEEEEKGRKGKKDSRERRRKPVPSP